MKVKTKDRGADESSPTGENEDDIALEFPRAISRRDICDWLPRSQGQAEDCRQHTGDQGEKQPLGQARPLCNSD